MMPCLWTKLFIVNFVPLFSVTTGQDPCTPHDCTVSEWSDWSDCTKTCGGSGTQTRTRTIIHEASCGGSCNFNVTGLVSCGRQCCPQNCEYSNWTDWFYIGVTTTCEGGGERYTYKRIRSKVKNEDCGGFCDDQPLSQTVCTKLVCYQDCVLGQWSFWSICEAPCEQKGTQLRKKVILQEPRCGGKQCGLLEEEAECIGSCCPVDCQLGDWSDWSDCDTTCGVSNRTRTRNVRLPDCKGQACSEDPKSIDTLTCEKYENIDCVVGPWTVWSACALYIGHCGEGIKNRTRSIIVQQKCRGQVCPDVMETGVCYGECCRQDCNVTNWTTWTPCSSSCGKGISQREREVIIKASCNGTSCPELLDSRNCTVTEKIHCKLSEWSEWSECNTDCGHGKQTRTRLLLTPAYCGGDQCSDTTLEDERPCESYEAKRHCELSLWSDWGDCIRDCDTGQQIRRRTILQHPQCYGAMCLPTSESRSCHVKCSQLCNQGVCSCEVGHRLSSNNHSCYVVECPFPRVQYCPPERKYPISCKYASFNCPSFKYNSSCTAFCTSGWTLRGEVRTVQCLHTGLWTQPEVYCLPPNNPPTEIDVNDVKINENTPAGNCFTFMSTKDDFYDKHTYKIIDDIKHIFSVEDYDLCLTRTADFEEKPTKWNVTIRSIDIAGAFIDAVFEFEILNANDPPKSATLTPDEIPENSPSGTRVGCLNATDDESKQNLTITLLDSQNSLFSAFNEDDQVCIKVLKESDPKCFTEGGKFCALNLEEQPENIITVMVMDDSNPPGVSYFDLPIKLSDVNDRPTGVYLSGAGVLENVQPGDPVAAIETLDEDKGQNYTYELIKDESGLFSIIDQNLTATKLFDYEDPTQKGKEYLIEIKTSDDGNPPMSVTATVKFGILDVNESPYDLHLTSSNGPVRFPDNKPQIKENANAVIIGTIMVKDHDQGDEVTISLPDLQDDRISLMTQMCSYMQDMSPYCFASLVSFGSFDHETEPVVNFSIKATDTKGLGIEQQLQMEVLNVNDAPKDILLDGNATNVTSVYENRNDFVVCNLTSVDDDVTDIPTFFLKESDGGRFIIDGKLLKTSPTAGLDFETSNKHEIILEVFDNGEPSLSFEKTILVEVLDENEPPADISLSNSKIDENSEDAALVGVLATDDPDNKLSIKQTFTYSLVENGADRFQIVGNELQVKRSAVCPSNKQCNLDYETQQRVDIKVKVTDNGTPSKSLDKTFTILINDVNDPPYDVKLTKKTLPENDPINSPVGKLTATDEDKGQTLTFELLDNTDTFTLDTDSTLLTKLVLDYELQSTYNITVKVSDSAVPPASVVSTVTVTVLDINESPFFSGETVFNIPEQPTAGKNIGYVTLVDPDRGDNLKIKVSSGALNFEISNVTCTDKSTSGSECVGVLTSLIPLDYEEKSTYTITIAAEDKTGLTVTRQQTVVVKNVNEQPKDILFDGKPLTQISFPEMNQHIDIAELSAVDPDEGQSHSFSLTSGSLDVFEIVNTTLHVKFGVSLDYELENKYILTIEVKDNGQPPLSLEKNITVMVEDVNEPPTSLSLDNNKVAENSGEDFTIGIFQVEDPDNLKEIVQSFKFELLKNSEGRFKVSGDKLQVALSNTDCLKLGGDACGLNYEKTQSHMILVLVSDSGHPSNSSIFNITVDVMDANDRPRDLQLSGYKVDKSAPSGTDIGHLSVSDEDKSQTHSFYLVDDASGQFAVSLDGKVTKATNNDLDLKTLYKITVKAIDSGEPPQEIKGNFTITATGVDKVPPNVTLTSESGVIKFEENAPVVMENTLPDTVIGTLVAVDNVVDQKMTFDIEFPGGHGQILKVNQSDIQCVSETDMSRCKAKVVVAAELDFEQGNAYSMVAMVTDNDGMTAVEQFQLTIQNQNEAPTNLSFSGGHPAVEENVNSELLGVFVVSDPDAGDQHTFELTDDGDGKFVITAAAGRLSTSPDANLDFEMTPSVQITLKVKDSGGLGLEKTFTVHIININEKPKNLTLSGYSVKEMSAPGTKVGTMATDDPDEGQSFTYALIDDAGGRFVLDGDTVKVGQAGENCDSRGYDSCLLDFETRSSYDIVIQTTDDGEPALSDTFTVTIHLEDVNDPPTGLSVHSMDMHENLPVNETIATIEAEDQDSDQSLTFSVTEDDDQFFVVRNSIKLKKLMDFETKSSYTVLVTAVDNGSPPKQISEEFELKVLNVNEAPYNINLEHVSGKTEKFPVNQPTIAENSETVTLIGQLVVQDHDGQDTVSFDTTSSDVEIHNQNCFSLTKGTRCSADIYTARTFDYETVNATTLVFTATDKDRLSVTATIPLEILDVNDPPTDILVSGELPLAVEENKRDITLATLDTVDPDNGQSHTYSIQSDTNFFYVVGQKLRVASAADLDYESQSEYEVVVRATDNGHPPQYLDKTFTITIKDVNEKPHSISLSRNLVPEDVTTDYMIGLLSADDPDNAYRQQQTLTFTLTDSASDRFKISGNRLMVNKADFDYETSSLFKITVKVSDAGTPPMSESEELSIIITDANDQPTNLKLSVTKVEENLPLDTVVGTLTADDEDEGQTLSYSLTSSQYFAVSEDKLLVHGMIDFEATTTITIQANATDNGHPPKMISKTFTVKIIDMNDGPTSIDLEPATTIKDMKIPEVTGIGEVIATVQALDPDQSDKLRFNLSDNQEGVLKLSSARPTCFTNSLTDGDTTGLTTMCSVKLELANRVNYEDGAEEIEVMVMAVDSGGLTISKKWTFGVANSNEPPKDITIDGNITHIPENTAGFTIGALVTEDEDVGDKHFYQVITHWQQFVVQGNKLVAKEGLDYEMEDIYEVKVKSTDNGSPPLSLTKTFQFHVTDINEKPTNISVNPSEVSNGASVGDIVGIVKVTDPDNYNREVPVQTHNCTVGGDGLDLFTVEYLTMKLKVASILPLEKSEIKIMVTCTDSGVLPQRFTKALVITVKEIVEVPKKLVIKDHKKVPENTDSFDIGQLQIINMLTKEPISGFFLYFLTDANLPFEISGDHLHTNQKLNYEEKQEWEVLVKAAGMDNHMKKVDLNDTKLTIEVKDVNEAPYNIGIYGGGFIEENSKTGTLIGKLNTQDIEKYQTYTYSIISVFPRLDTSAAIPDYMDMFVLVEKNLTVGNATQFFDYEDFDFFTVMVQTTDSGSPPLSYNGTVHIVLQDVNDPPTDISLSNNEIAENSTAGTVIGQLTVTDQDKNQSHICEVVNIQSVPFKIKNNFTLVLTSQTLDFETVWKYLVKIDCHDFGKDKSTLSFRKTFEINVTNVNEPPFDIGITSNIVKENNLIGVSVGELTVKDVDSKNVYFSINANPHFKLLGDDTLVAEEIFDYEEKSEYIVNVTATDAEGASSSAELLIMIQDMNERPTDISLDEATVEENSEPGTIIGILTTEDQDREKMFTYVVIETTSEKGYFGVEDDRLVTGSRMFDFETSSEHRILINSSDSSDPPLTIQKEFTVTVEDINESPIDIILSTIAPIPEDTILNTILSAIQVDDPDMNQSHICKVTSVDSPFVVATNENHEMNLVLNGVLDFETASGYTVILECSDGEFEIRKTVNVLVKDINEAPESISLSGTMTIVADIEIGEVVGVLSVDEPDKNQTHTFNVGGPNSNILKVEKNAVVMLSKIPVSELTKAYPVISFTVTATDNGNPPLSVTETFTLPITDIKVVEKKLPSITLDNVEVPEDAGLNFRIGKLYNHNESIGENIVFQITNNPDNIFAIEDNMYLILIRNLTEVEGTSRKITVEVKNMDTFKSQSEDITIFIKRIETCQENGLLCDENARCVWTNDTGRHMCLCEAGFHGNGSTCENADDCLVRNDNGNVIGDNPCENNGMCVDELDSYSCICTDNYGGDNCEISKVITSPCSSSPCNNGGACITDSDNATSFTCECEAGWIGHVCDISEDDCQNAICYGNGSCVDKHRIYICLCTEERYGVRCQYLRKACVVVGTCDSDKEICVPKVNKAEHLCVVKAESLVSLAIKKSDSAQRTEEYKVKIVNLLTNFIEQQDTKHQKNKRKKRDTSAGQKVNVYIVSLNEESANHYTVDFVVVDYPDGEQVYSKEEVLDMLSKTCQDIKLSNLIETEICPGVAEVTAQRPASPEDSSGLPIPIIAGAGGGGVLVIVLIIVIVCVVKRRKSKDDATPGNNSKKKGDGDTESRRSSGYASISKTKSPVIQEDVQPENLQNNDE